MVWLEALLIKIPEKVGQRFVKVAMLLWIILVLTLNREYYRSREDRGQTTLIRRRQGQKWEKVKKVASPG
jgi:hypothetical protein